MTTPQPPTTPAPAVPKALADLGYLEEHSFGLNIYSRIANIREALQEGAERHPKNAP